MDCKIQSYNYVRAKMFGKKPTLVNRLIAVRSAPQTHTEFQFSERYGNISFSATMQDDSKCARFKQIAYSHARERWDTVVVPMTDQQEDMAWNKAKQLEGTPYDLIGLICHVTPLKIWTPSEKKVWCTKAVYELLRAGCPSFAVFLAGFGITPEIRPDQMDMMARYFFRKD